MSYNNSSSNHGKFKNITENILFLENKGSRQEDMQFTGVLPMSGLWFYYNHQGSGKCDFQNFSMDSSNKRNQLSILTANYDEGNISIPKGIFHSSSITLEKEFLLKSLPEGKVKEKIIENLESNKPCELLAKKDITPHVQVLLNSLYNNPFTNSLDNLYAQSKILELIHLEFQSLIDIEPTKNNKIKLDAYDIEAIKKAKEILIQNIQNPPSIVELSRQVRINEFKLKCGFKKVFNDTPYNILLHHKLEYATELLKNGEMSVGEIASITGYKSLSSFTKAFTKKHGLRPIDLMKSRKYYY